jgi:hypothetical protein
MKDAGAKAAASRLKTLEKRKWKSAGQKAAETRKRNAIKAANGVSGPASGGTD